MAEMYVRRSRKFCQSGSIFLLFIFVVDEGIEHPNTIINGPLAGR